MKTKLRHAWFLNGDLSRLLCAYGLDQPNSENVFRENVCRPLGSLPGMKLHTMCVLYPHASFRSLRTLSLMFFVFQVLLAPLVARPCRQLRARPRAPYL